MLSRGLTQVYTGNSGRMTFAPIGLAMRAAGQDLRIHMTSFLPYEWMDGEGLASKFLKTNLVINHIHMEPSVPPKKWKRADVNEARGAFESARKALLGGEFDLVILNGIHPICTWDVISPDEILNLMKEKPDHVELVLEGSEARKAIIDEADLVTEMICSAPQSNGERADGVNARAPTEVVTGDGKGKTTYSLGKAMLMSSMGIPSTVLQFVKSPRAYGEVKAIEKLPYLHIRSMGKGFLGGACLNPRNKARGGGKAGIGKRCQGDLLSKVRAGHPG